MKMKEAKKKPSKPRGRAKKPAQKSEPIVPEDRRATERFLQDLTTRGEAVEIPAGGKLPSQATHVITKKNPDGTVQVKRARFKLA
jgi:hypothetical protein